MRKPSWLAEFIADRQPRRWVLTYEDGTKADAFNRPAALVLIAVREEHR